MEDDQFGLATKVVLITGGATGIGRATVQAFAAQGARVVFTDISDLHGPAVEAELRARGQEALFIRSDAADEAQVEALIDGIVESHGRLDILINVVGGVGIDDGSRLQMHETPLTGFENTVDLNLRTTFLSMKHAIRVMLAQGGGVIANTASLASVRTTTNGSPSYHAAKAGVILLTRKAAVDYARQGIRVNVVAPGATATDLMRRNHTADQLAEMVKGTQPMGRMVKPEEIADAFLWLCSGRASAVTGVTIPVDCGWSAT